MEAKQGMERMEEALVSIRKAGENIEDKNSKRNKEITQRLKENTKKCDDLFNSYSQAFDIPD